MQGDEAGEEGSGSGRNYPDDDAAYDSEGSGEEGSGLQESGKSTVISSNPVQWIWTKATLLYFQRNTNDQQIRTNLRM